MAGTLNPRSSASGRKEAFLLIGLGCVIGVTVVVAIARALRTGNMLNENRMMRDYLRETAPDRNSDF